MNVLSNQLDVDSADLLLKVKAEKPNLRTLCGLTHEETELDLSFESLGPGDAKLLAPEISVIASLTSVRSPAHQLTPCTLALPFSQLCLLAFCTVEPLKQQHWWILPT